MDTQERTSPFKLVNIDRLMDEVFDPESKPTKRFMLELKARGNIPFYKIGRRVFYDVNEVRQAIAGMARRG